MSPTRKEVALQARAAGIELVLAWPLAAAEREHLAWALDGWEAQGWRGASVALPKGLYFTPDGGAIVQAARCFGVLRLRGRGVWRHAMTAVPHRWSGREPARRTREMAELVSRGWVTWHHARAVDGAIVHELERTVRALLRPELCELPALEDAHVVKWAARCGQRAWRRQLVANVLRTGSPWRFPYQRALPLGPEAWQRSPRQLGLL